jgi:lipid-A-disaccharide synthase
MRIFISVAENSADLHAAALIRAAGRRIPNAQFEGLTGPRMRAAGAKTVVDFASSAAMLAGVFGVIGKGFRAIDAATLHWGCDRPDVVVLIDSGVLNLPLARRAHARGIPVVYYVAPQTWASREYRNGTLRRAVSRVACILPFEESYFRRQGVNATFVGHPLFESLALQRPRESIVAALRQTDMPLVAALPGSRRHVVETMLPLQFAVWDRLRELGIATRLAVSAADDERREWIQQFFAKRGYASRVWRLDRTDATIEPSPAARRVIDLVLDDNASLLTAADLVLVASGTATLHVAHYRKPMIVMYDAGRLLGAAHRALGRWVVHTPHLSLVNILGERRIVPEFMPSVPSPDVVARVAASLLTDSTWRGLTSSQLNEIVRPLENSSASDRVCDMIAELGDGNPMRSGSR